MEQLIALIQANTAIAAGLMIGLGALGAFGDAGAYTNQGGVLTVFALDNTEK